MSCSTERRNHVVKTSVRHFHRENMRMLIQPIRGRASKVKIVVCEADMLDAQKGKKAGHAATKE